jgi:spore coat polysaccharide biosynthesis predicted glycosyltransferase SpsG
MSVKSKFLVITEASKKSGLGNYKRSLIICKELSKVSDVKLVVITDSDALDIDEVPSSFHIEKIRSILDFSEFDDHFSHALMDVGTLDLGSFVCKLKEINPSIKLIALDYFFESKLLDLRISLFDQSTHEFLSNDPKHLVGLEYAVIDELGEIVSEKNSQPVITVRFSGESKKILERTTSVLESFYPKGTVQIQTIDNTGFNSKKYTPLSRPEFLRMIYNSELVICSGVTTLLECSLLGVPTVFVGSNSLESNFGEVLEKENRIKFLNGFSDCYESKVRAFIHEIDLQSININLIPKLDLDFMGKHRILRAILTL